MGKTARISFIVPFSERYDDLQTLYPEYKCTMEAVGAPYESIFVLDGEFPDILDSLKRLQSSDEPLQIVTLTRSFGEAAASKRGLRDGGRRIFVALPAYHQVEATALPLLLEELKLSDMIVARRWPRYNSWFNRLQTKIFAGHLQFISRSEFRDLGCSVRAMSREVAEEIAVYGDQHRFLPLLAARGGFKVSEIDLPQSKKDKRWRVYGSGIYVRRVLDLLTVFFLTKFTKKPFFGLLGTGTATLGFLYMLYVASERLFFGVPLADRPALLLSSLLVVPGVQLFAIGLLDELVIFVYAKELKEYRIEQVVEGGFGDFDSYGVQNTPCQRVPSVSPVR